MARLALCLLLIAPVLDAEELSFRLYQIGGRSWTIKIVPNAGGDGNLDVNYMKYEVQEVHEDHALVSYIRLDTSKKIPKGVTATITKMRFDAALPPFKQPDGAQNLGVQTIKAAGMNFECDVYSSGTPPSKYFCSRRYPGLVVKTEASFGVDELCDFDAFKDDEPAPAPRKGQKAPKDPPKEPAKAPDEFSLFKARHSWILSERAASGPAVLRKYEVLKWDEAGADVKWTELDEAKKPVKGGKSQSLRVEFKEGESAKFALPEGASKSRVEKRRFGPNVLECTVYTFRQEGKEGQIWISNLYPGLVVRQTLDGGKQGVTELLEFK